jgi:maltose/moltooligosaccharide transporter
VCGSAALWHNLRTGTRRMERERVFRYGLTAGEMGSAGGQTLIAALLPVLLAPHAPSTFWIGAVIATEGLFALLLPYAAGAVSDSMPPKFSRFFGRRATLLALAAPVLACALLFISFRDSFFGLAGIAVLYFAGLHVYSTPLRALLIDTTPRRHWGSVQGVMGATHLAGVTFGLVAGGLLFSVWEHLPFLAGAGLVVITSGITLYSAVKLGLRNGDDGTSHEDGAERDDGADSEREQQTQTKREVTFWKELLGERESRQVLLANVLWNAGVEGIRPYLFLFATVVLGITISTASLALLAFLIAAAVASVFIGRLGDRFGRARVLLGGALICGVAMIPGLFVRDLLPLLLLLVPAGVGAAAIVSLPYPVFETTVPNGDVGRSTGTFYMSVGIARLTAPLLVGAAIDLGRAWLPDQEGYPVMWPIAGTFVLLGAAVLYLTMRKSKLGEKPKK